MKNRVLSVLLVVFTGAGLYVVSSESRNDHSLETLDAIESFYVADGRLNQSVVLLFSEFQLSFDHTQSALIAAHEALEMIDASVQGQEDLTRLAAKLREHSRTKENLVLRALRQAASIQGSRHRAERLLRIHGPELDRESVPLLATWLKCTLVPSEKNLGDLKGLFSETGLRGTIREELETRGSLLVAEQIAARAALDEILELPLEEDVAALRNEARRAGERVTIRNRWRMIAALVVVCGLAFVVQNLIGRLEQSRNFERQMNDRLEQEVAERTQELQNTNQRLAADIARRREAELERDRMEVELRNAQKLESVGQLAAGIAHEINTPTQFVGDNTRFLQESFGDVNRILAAAEAAVSSQSPDAPVNLSDLKQALVESDLDFLKDEIPKALDQSLEGLNRVSRIVGALKEFSHPGVEQRASTDIRRAIESTLAVATNEWKYVAEVQTKFDPDLEPVPCFPGEFNQALLNIIVNAAHSIGDVLGDRGVERGRLSIETRRLDEWAEIRVSDTGAGIPSEIQERIFDPFFTTKEVGKGTGQGLYITHSVVVQKHGGRVDFETEEGVGTTFIIQLPLKPPDGEPETDILTPSI